MPIIVHGFKWGDKSHHQEPIPNVKCNSCHRGNLYFVKIAKYKTFFRVKTFSGGTSYSIKCDACKNLFEVNPQMLQTASSLNYVGEISLDLDKEE